MHNSARHYGPIARSLHWLTAALILTTFPLGLYAEGLPHDTSAALAYKAQLFSIHKTLGVAAFFTALVRVIWALTQPRPAPLHPERRLETFVADLIHWSLYVAMLAVPLSGWLGHAATEGFAPIVWPFGQDLPFIPKSPDLAHAFSFMHWLSTKLLLVSLVLHIAGALKHAVIDRDGTLARMIHGTPGGTEIPHRRSPAAAAMVVWVVALGAAAPLSTPQTPAAQPAATAATAPPPAPSPMATGTTPIAGLWQVQTGSLSFTVAQMGAPVTGQFGTWQAEIAYDPATDSGTVRVMIDTASLTLGSVTDQAKGVDFFDTATHPQAVFEGPIQRGTGGHEVAGTLSLRGVQVPVTLPFTLTIAGDTATASGELSLDRRDFGMGASYSDESSVGFAVQVAFELTAARP